MSFIRCVAMAPYLLIITFYTFEFGYKGAESKSLFGHYCVWLLSDKQWLDILATFHFSQLKHTHFCIRSRTFSHLDILCCVVAVTVLMSTKCQKYYGEMEETEKAKNMMRSDHIV